MALRKNFANIPFAAGLDTKTDELQLPIGYLQSCQNAIFTAPNKLQTRFGYKGLPENYTLSLLGFNETLQAGTNGLVVLPRSISSYQDKLVKTFDHNISSWSPSENSWILNGNLESLYVTASRVTGSTVQQYQQDQTVHPSGIQGNCWVQNEVGDGTPGVWVQFTDTNTGQVLVSAFPVSLPGAASNKPKMLSVGNYIVLFWMDSSLSGGTTPVIVMAAWTSNLSGAPVTTNVTGISVAKQDLNATYCNYDATVCVTPQGEQLYLAFINVLGGFTVLAFGADANQWTPLTVVVANNTIVQSLGGIWLCTTSGTTGTGAGGAQGPPSGVGPTYADGSAVWTYQGPVVSNITTPTRALYGLDVDAQVMSIFGDSPSPVNNITSELIIPFYDGALYRIFQVSTDLTSDFTHTIHSISPPIISITGCATLPPNPDGSRNVWTFLTIGGQADAPTGSTSTVLAVQLGNSFLIDNAWDVMNGVALAGKAFSTEGYAFIPVAYQSVEQNTMANPPGFCGFQNTYFIVNQNGDTVARLLPGSGGGFTYTSQINGNNGSLPLLCEVTPYGNKAGAQGMTVDQTGNMIWKMALLQQTLQSELAITSPSDFTTTTPPQFGTFTTTGVTSFTFDFWSQQNGYVNVEAANTLVYGGGFPSYYDGQQTTEVGFHLYPENLQILADTSGGNLKDNTDYWYCAIYQWTNAQGSIERSAPSVPMKVTTGNSGSNTCSVTIQVPYLRTTAKGPNAASINGGNPQSALVPQASIVIYRNLGESNGTIFYENNVTITAGVSPTTNSPITNDPSQSGTAQYLDQMPDADMAANLQLYTTGNVVENLPTNPLSDLCIHNNRVFGIDSTSPLVLWFSKQIIPGTPVQMSGYFTFNVDPRGGPITAIRELDSYLIVFKQDQIYSVSGVGPDATGGQGNYQDAVPVSSDCGCIDARSIVLGPNGLYFQSAKGLAHLDRGLVVTYLGAPVEGLVNGNVITSANIVPYTQQMRFTVQPPTDTTTTNLAVSPSLIMHDYYINAPLGQWGQHTNINAQDACIWQNQYVYLRSDGVALIETPNLYSDNGSAIPLSITSWWINYTMLNGWCRTWLLYIQGQILSPANVTVGLAFDNNPTVVQSITFAVQPATAFGALPFGQGPFGGIYPEAQWAIQPMQGLAQSVQVTITVKPTGSSPGAGISLSGLGMEYGVSSTMRRPSMTNYFGGST